MNLTILSSKYRYVIASTFLGCFLAINATAQTEPTDEQLDNSSEPAKQYELNGKKYTFDYDLSDTQLQMLGTWNAESGSSEVQVLLFSGPEDVIVTVGGKQFKGYWSEAKGVLNVTINSSDSKIPSQLKGRIETAGKASVIVLDNFGTFQKTTDK